MHVSSLFPRPLFFFFFFCFFSYSGISFTVGPLGFPLRRFHFFFYKNPCHGPNPLCAPPSSFRFVFFSESGFIFFPSFFPFFPPQRGLSLLTSASLPGLPPVWLPPCFYGSPVPRVLTLAPEFSGVSDVTFFFFSSSEPQWLPP